MNLLGLELGLAETEIKTQSHTVSQVYSLTNPLYLLFQLKQGNKNLKDLINTVYMYMYIIFISILQLVQYVPTIH